MCRRGRRSAHVQAVAGLDCSSGSIWPPQHVPGTQHATITALHAGEGILAPPSGATACISQMLSKWSRSFGCEHRRDAHVQPASSTTERNVRNCHHAHAGICMPILEECANA